MRIIILTVFFLSWFSLNAQINAGEENDNTFHVFEGGFALGFNMSQVHGDLFSGFNKLGLNAGPVLHINFSENWFLKMEILFTQKGSRATPSQTINLGYTYNLRFNYVEIPVMIGYNDKNRLLFQAGAGYGRLFSVIEEIQGVNTTNENNYENSEISYIIGGTILLGEKKHYGLDVRYQGSITSVGVPRDPTFPGLVNALISIRGIYFF